MIRVKQWSKNLINHVETQGDMKQDNQIDKKEKKRLYDKEWHEKNKEKHNEIVKRWREENPEKYKDGLKQWYEKNKEKHKENVKRWQEKNKKKHIDNVKKWREENKEKYRELLKQWREENKAKIAQDNKKRYNLAKAKKANDLLDLQSQNNNIYNPIDATNTYNVEVHNSLLNLQNITDVTALSSQQENMDTNQNNPNNLENKREERDANDNDAVQGLLQLYMVALHTDQQEEPQSANQAHQNQVDQNIQQDTDTNEKEPYVWKKHRHRQNQYNAEQNTTPHSSNLVLDRINDNQELELS